MRMYASWTGTYRNLDAMREHGFSLLMSPFTYPANGWKRPTWTDGSPAPFALDNGAWSYFQRGIPFEDETFLRAVEVSADFERWIVVPDIVSGGAESLTLSKSWIPRLAGKRLLIAVQDGMTPEEIAPLITGDVVGIFIGGSTEWKLKTLQMWGKMARALDCLCHVGRVNTHRRIRSCLDASVTSCDGTSATIYSVNTPKLARVASENNLFRRTLK